MLQMRRLRKLSPFKEYYFHFSDPGTIMETRSLFTSIPAEAGKRYGIPYI